MLPNARHAIRPFQPPKYEVVSSEQDAVQSSAPVTLHDLTQKWFSEAKKAVADFSKGAFPTSKPGYDVVITPLGTSSACPTKYRNGRAI
jgi:ribonuclease Z